jgi:hypothetical protein
MSRSQPELTTPSDPVDPKLSAARQRRGNVWTPDMPKPSWYRERPVNPEDTDKYEPDYYVHNEQEEREKL